MRLITVGGEKQGRGVVSKYHLRLSPLLFIAILLLIGILTFFTSFLYTRQSIISKQISQLRQINRCLELSNGNNVGSSEKGGERFVSEEDLRRIENRLRAEYESTIAVITSQLNELLEIEVKARQATGLAPKYKAPVVPTVQDKLDRGKGGPVGRFSYGGTAMSMGVVSVPTFLRTTNRLSADLILQEIALRKIGLQDLLKGVEIKNAKIERTPSFWPIYRRMGRLMSNFGYRRDPFTHRIRHHDGVDISAPYGTRVLSAGKGVVKFAGREGDYGNLVVIDHGDGVETAYAHLSRIFVKVGQKVEKGEEIGQVGSTGRSTGPHLHFEVRVGGTPVNPLKYLNR